MPINAVAESFFASLKKELGRRHFRTRAEARQAIFVWINYYNQRIHEALGYVPPAEHETNYYTRSTPALTAGTH